MNLNTLSYDNLIARLLADNKNVILLDTCALLDVMRCLSRNNIDIFNSGLQISNAISDGSIQFNIIYPSVFITEWENNLVNEKLNTDKWLETQYINMQSVHNLITAMCIPITLTKGAFHKQNISDKVETMLEKLIEFGCILIEDDNIKIKAVDRVSRHIAPSARGKDSTNDCIIFEEVLAVGKALREAGFNKKIIFVTSNTTEYFENGIVKNKIEQDLQISAIKITKTLNHAEYEATH